MFALVTIMSLEDLLTLGCGLLLSVDCSQITYFNKLYCFFLRKICCFEELMQSIIYEFFWFN